MSLTHNTPMQNYLCDAWAGRFANGTLTFTDNNSVVLVTISLGPTPFLPATGGEAGLSAAVQGTSTGTGTITTFELTDATSTYRTTGEVGDSVVDGDLLLSNRNVVVGSIVSVSTFTLRQPESHSEEGGGFLEV